MLPKCIDERIESSAEVAKIPNKHPEVQEPHITEHYPVPAEGSEEVDQHVRKPRNQGEYHHQHQGDRFLYHLTLSYHPYWAGWECCLANYSVEEIQVNMDFVHNTAHSCWYEQKIKIDRKKIGPWISFVYLFVVACCYNGRSMQLTSNLAVLLKFLISRKTILVNVAQYVYFLLLIRSIMKRLNHHKLSDIAFC